MKIMKETEKVKKSAEIRSKAIKKADIELQMKIEKMRIIDIQYNRLITNISNKVINFYLFNIFIYFRKIIMKKP